MIKNSTSYEPAAVTSGDPVNNQHISADAIFGGKSLLMQVTYYVVCSFGIPGNLITIIVLGSAPKLRKKPINLFLVSVINII